MVLSTVSLSALTRKFRLCIQYVTSRRAIPPAKGAIAYLLAVYLIFIQPFDGLLRAFPVAYTSMIIVTIAGSPGKSIGACFQGLGFALFGIGMGAVAFVILAELGHAPVAQGFVFAIFVYLMALLKSRGQRWFGCSLLAILMGFNGIYTSTLLRGEFSTGYLKNYLEAYLWGGAIVLSVNVLVFPISSEKELRRTLITSLEHVATFSHILAKTYCMEITDEERNCREKLLQAIRADFGFLEQKIEETSIEINYSMFSMKDYRAFVAQLRIIQQSLITAYSSLAGVQKRDLDLFRLRFLPGIDESFLKLRRAIDLSIREIGEQLNCKPMYIPATQSSYTEFMDHGDLEQQSTTAQFPEESKWDIENQLQEVSRRLAEEVETRPSTPVHSATPSAALGTSRIEPLEDASIVYDASVSHKTITKLAPSPGDTAETETAVSTTAPAIPLAQLGIAAEPKETGTTSRHTTRKSQECGIIRLHRLFDAFSENQHRLFMDSLTSGQLHGDDDTLRLHEPLPSLHALYGPDIPNAFHEDDYSPFVLRNRKSEHSSGANEKEDSSSASESVQPEGDDEKTRQQRLCDQHTMASHHSLLRVYAFLFAMGQFVESLEVLWNASKPKPKRIHVHLFESLQRPHAGTDADGERDLSLAEALALLENRNYQPERQNFWQHLEKVEQMFRSPTSIYSGKVAAAASVFALLILVKEPQAWFIKYGLTSGLLTIVVALAPTLGQSIATFVLQILGSSIGYIYGLILLEIFRGVGGFTYNPYGIGALLIPYACVMCYILYEKPKFFVISFLGLNGTAVLCGTEWIYTEHLKQKFDKPPLRTGKTITALCLSLAIVAIFQLFVLRNPARRTLRKRVAHVVQSNLSLLTLLQAYVRAVLAIPADPKIRTNNSALRRVEEELRHRELKIQSELISLVPLVTFAAAEPEYTRPFKVDVINRLIRINQVILDRFREARTALGTEPLDDFIIKEFVVPLSTYRRLNYRLMKNSLHLVTTSLASKTPLPHETPAQWSRTNDFLHDALVLSTRVARNTEGAIDSSKFIRYWAYLMCICNCTEQLVMLESATKELMGELESKLL